jgi:hypothetical protein
VPSRDDLIPNAYVLAFPNSVGAYDLNTVLIKKNLQILDTKFREAYCNNMVSPSQYEMRLGLLMN